jgi:hypothetical protein
MKIKKIIVVIFKHLILVIDFMVKKILLLIKVATSIIFFSSCTDSYKEDFSSVLKETESTRSVIINGSVTSEFKHHIVYVQESSNYSDVDNPFNWGHNGRDIRGATVYVEIANKKYEFQEKADTSSLGYSYTKYESIDSFAGIPLEEHKLVVELYGKTYTATDVMPKISTFDLTGDDAPFMQSSTMSGVIIDTTIFYPPYFFGQTIGHMISYRADDPSVQEESNICFFRQLAAPQLMSIPFASHRSGGIYSMIENRMYTFKKLSCSAAYENYLYNYFNATLCVDSKHGNMPSNMPTNITNGGAGFFAAQDVITKRYNFSELAEKAKNAGHVLEPYR